MEAINSAIVFEETHVASKEEFATSVDIESMENLIDFVSLFGPLYSGSSLE